MDLIAAAQSHYERFAELFSAAAFDRMDELWDLSDAQPFYIAEEHPVLMQSWAELRRYWEISQRVNGASKLKWQVVSAKRLGPDTILSMFRLDWMIHVNGQPKPFGGSNRGFGVLRQTSAGWKFLAHCEAPLAPITWVKSVYERLGQEHGR